jgi:hypothetical protein
VHCVGVVSVGKCYMQAGTHRSHDKTGFIRDVQCGCCLRPLPSPLPPPTKKKICAYQLDTWNTCTCHVSNCGFHTHYKLGAPHNHPATDVSQLPLPIRCFNKRIRIWETCFLKWSISSSVCSLIPLYGAVRTSRRHKMVLEQLDWFPAFYRITRHDGDRQNTFSVKRQRREVKRVHWQVTTYF